MHILFTVFAAIIAARVVFQALTTRTGRWVLFATVCIPVVFVVLGIIDPIRQ